MLSENWFLITCYRCREDMGYVDPEELKALLEASPLGPLCFNCDLQCEANLLPDVLNNSLSKGALVFDDGLEVQIFDCPNILDREGFGPVQLNIIFVCTHERWTHARGLSSSTYLNNAEVFLVLPKWILGESFVPGANDFQLEGSMVEMGEGHEPF